MTLVEYFTSNKSFVIGIKDLDLELFSMVNGHFQMHHSSPPVYPNSVYVRKVLLEIKLRIFELLTQMSHD